MNGEDVSSSPAGAESGTSSHGNFLKSDGDDDSDAHGEESRDEGNSMLQAPPTFCTTLNAFIGSQVWVFLLLDSARMAPFGRGVFGIPKCPKGPPKSLRRFLHGVHGEFWKT